MTNKMRSIHPGEILRNELDAVGLTANALALRLHVPANRITGILNEQRSVTPETAIRLARFFGTSPEFWLNLQRDFDLKIAHKLFDKKIQQEIEPFDKAI